VKASAGRHRLQRRVVPLFAILHLSVAVVPATESTLQPSDLTELSLEELMNVEVTSVSRKPERRAAAADAIYVITEEDIRRSGVTTIPDALRLAPGVQVARIDANKWAVGIRGFASRLSRSVLVLIDGRSVYTPLFAGTYWEVQDTLLEDIERIEVIRGPGGTLWGANAVNGVINIITKHAKDTKGGFVTGGGGNEEQGFGAVRYGGRLGDKFHYRVYGKYFNRDGGRNPNGPDYDGWHMARQGFRADWDATPHDRFRLQGDVYDGNAGQRLELTQTRAPFTRRVTEDADISGGNILGSWSHNFGDASDVALKLYYDNTFRREPTFSERRNTWDIDFQHRIALPWDQELIWGLGYRHTADRTSAIETVVVDPRNRADDLYSGFIQDELRFFDDQVRLTVGSKFEHNDYSGFEGQPSARVAWVPSTRHMVWGSVARAVRTPSRVEDDLEITLFVAPTDSFLRVIGDGEFVSEKVISYEVGYRVQPHHLLFLDLVTFYNVYEDLFSLEPGAPFEEPGVERPIVPLFIRNRLHGETYGIELAADAEVQSWWRLHGVYSILQVDLERDPGSRDAFSEEAEDTSPHHQVTVRSTMSLPGETDFDTVLRYVDNISAMGVGSYVELDLRLAKRVHRNVELSVVGLNLLHDHHREFNGGTQVERSIYGQVRWWW